MTSLAEHELLSGARRWRALVVLSVGQLMVVLDSTVVNVALPTIQRDLHFSQASLAWVVNSYLITFGGLLLLGGRLGDLIGRRRLFLLGLSAFSLTSLVCGISPTADLLIAARFAQGACAAAMSSMVLGMLSPMFPDLHERAKALSIFAAVTLSGAALGLPLGGVVTEFLSWHWIFYINVPIGLTATLLGGRLLQPQKGLGLRAGADLAGALVVTAGPMLLVYGLIQTSSAGWASPNSLVPFALAALSIPVFISLESHVKTPLIPLRTFKNRNLITANSIRLIFPMGAFGLNFLGSQFLQLVMGYSALRTGLSFLPTSSMIAVMSVVIVPRLTPRFGAKNLIIVGLVLISAGLLLFSRAPVDGTYLANVLPCTLLIGSGIGLVFTPTVGLALSNAPAEDAGLISGVTNLAPQLGGSIGIALLASVAAGRTMKLLAAQVGRKAALAAGFHFGFLIGGFCPLVGLLVAVVLLDKAPARSDVAIPISETLVVPE